MDLIANVSPVGGQVINVINRLTFEADYDGKDCQVRDKTPVIEVLAAGIHATARLSDPDKPSHSLMEGVKDVKMKMAGSVAPVARVGKVGLSTHILNVSVKISQTTSG